MDIGDHRLAIGEVVRRGKTLEGLTGRRKLCYIHGIRRVVGPENILSESAWSGSDDTDEPILSSFQPFSVINIAGRQLSATAMLSHKEAVLNQIGI